MYIFLFMVHPISPWSNTSFYSLKPWKKKGEKYVYKFSLFFPFFFFYMKKAFCFQWCGIISTINFILKSTTESFLASKQQNLLYIRTAFQLHQIIWSQQQLFNFSIHKDHILSFFIYKSKDISSIKSYTNIDFVSVLIHIPFSLSLSTCFSAFLSSLVQPEALFFLLVNNRNIEWLINDHL